MGERADIFLASFNRIEKWLREELDNPRNMGFSEMVRRLSKQKNPEVQSISEDLLQMAQLRNAIVHERVGENFVIAEPNDWVIKRITEIESLLLKPELVLPKFGKRVTGFEITLPVNEILRTIAEKRYSQFPLYDRGNFKGLITLRALGYWFAKESQSGDIKLGDKTAADLLMRDGKVTNYTFVSSTTTVTEAKQLFENENLLEAILITKDGHPNGNLLGIIRPRDIYGANAKEK